MDSCDPTRRRKKLADHWRHESLLFAFQTRRSEKVARWTNLCCGGTCTVKICLVFSISKEKKRKAPTERLPLLISSKKQLFTSNPASELTSHLQLLKVQMKYFPVQVEPTKQMSPILALSVRWKWIKERKSRISRLDSYKLKMSFRAFKRRTINWRERLPKTNNTWRQCPVYFLSIISSPDADVSSYTGLPNYATLLSIFEFLNPGEDCKNICS